MHYNQENNFGTICHLPLYMSALEFLTINYLRQSFGPTTFQRAQAYLNNILGIDVGNDVISARVSGSKPQPYSLEIRLSQGVLNRIGIKSKCGCPMGGHCKHVAAVLIKLVSEQTIDTKMPESALQQWISTLREKVQPAAARKKPTKISAQIYYQLERELTQPEFGIRLYKGTILSSGRLADSAAGWDNIYQALIKPPQFVGETDLPILRILWSFCRPVLAGQPYRISGENGGRIFQMMLESGRLVLDGWPLAAGEARTAQIQWRINTQECLYPVIATTPPADFVLPLNPPYYLDATQRTAGLAESDIATDVLNSLLTIPPLTRQDISLAADALTQILPQAPLPTAKQLDDIPVIDCPPRGILLFDTVKTVPSFSVSKHRFDQYQSQLDYVQAQFQYAEVSVAIGQANDLQKLPSGETVRIKRQKKSELQLRKALEQSGLTAVKGYHLLSSGQMPTDALELNHAYDWEEFIERGIPKLQQSGWEIRYSSTFRHRNLEVEAWQFEVSEGDEGWFDLNMGIVVEGRRLALAPLLADLFQRDSRWLDGIRLQRILDKEKIELVSDDGQIIRVSAERLKPIAATLMDLFGVRQVPERLRISRLDAPRLTDLLSDTSRWQFKGADALQQIAERLKNCGSVQPITPPPSFQGTLRDYQQQGLAWLQYLRSSDLSGILADDMGLGKTAQAIAHLLIEKDSGRMDKACLIVLPTSLVFNWKIELARFAPSLSVLCLHGAERKEQFDQISKHDLVLTTYPLLWRDAEELAKFDYHLLILDEAQYVKNAGSKSATAVRQLRARHRLCLTGTPMENHLGELWAQFDFLMPGFLADVRSFNRTWRVPIEKEGDMVRLDLLHKRLKPFILRRRKEDVVLELPPKTIIVRAVELEGPQRDLYETVRSVMDSKVREEIALKGLQRSQIIILDALLKLRQVCCDPRLLKSMHAKKIEQSAKLEMLMDMVPEMVEEGRRILIFSQFTEMLALIEKALMAEKIGYVKLTGQTQDRESPVREFQTGKVPVFLISLKAGGVGLNLTAADTVIHYDPWWNPAAENQATDRAHRLGQNKAVFVYKLTVAGSIEERMLALQAQKSQLANRVLSRDENVEFKFGEAEIAALLAPLPDN
jgi:superfamily II DNA or RNA helicase